MTELQVSTTIRHTYYMPPQYFTLLQKLGDETEEIKPYTDKLIIGEMTFDEEMLYAFRKGAEDPSSFNPMLYGTEAEIA